MIMMATCRTCAPPGASASTSSSEASSGTGTSRTSRSTSTSTSSVSTRAALGSAAARRSGPMERSRTASSRRRSTAAACGRTSGSGSASDEEDSPMGLTGAHTGRQASLSSVLTLAAVLAAAALPAHAAAPPAGGAKPPAAGAPTGPPPPAGSPEVQAAVQLLEKGKTSDAKAALETILKREPKNGPAAFQLGKMAYAAQDSEAAIERFGRAVEAAPDSSLYHMWLGRAHAQKAIKASNIKRAFIAPSIKKEFEKAVALDPKHIDARFDLARFYVLAPGIMGGSVEKAKAQAAEVRKLDALQGHQCFAMIYEQQKQYDLAEKEYLAAVKENPDDRRAALWLGQHYQNRGKYAEAFEIFEKRAKLDPPDRGALYQIGKTAILSGQKLGRGEECLRLYLQGQPGEGEPSLAWAHFRLGMLLEKKGDPADARREYGEALRLQPDHEDAKKALAKLG